MTSLRRPLVLSGFMATGKSTVGRIVAEELRVPFVDLDDHIATEAGASVPELFAREGEGRFRDREAQAAIPMLRDGLPRVISFGGGTMTVEAVRHLALERATVVTLTARPETIVSRVESLSGRPNLVANSPLQRVSDLLALRREVYAECHAQVSTEGQAPEALAKRIVSIAKRDGLAMPLGGRSYTVEMADGEPELLTETLRELRPSSLLIVTDSNVRAARSGWLEAALRPLGSLRHTTVEIVPGEPSKNLTTVSRIWDHALAEGHDRDAVVVAFGGGVVGDLAGFVASTLLRGVRCVQIATTLLSMVDSSVGGKTGFDHVAGKNLIGSFFQPNRVIVDLEHLSTLPARERAAGLAEIVKIALVDDVELLRVLEGDAERLAAGDRAALRPVVRAAVQAKIRVVRDDERESGKRALLNLGHTVGHALEANGEYTSLLHGEAVAVGTVLEMRATARLGLTPSDLPGRAEALLRRLGLPVSASAAEVEAAWPFVLSDKKRAASSMRLPTVTGEGRGEVVSVAIDTLRDAVLATGA